MVTNSAAIHQIHTLNKQRDKQQRGEKRISQPSSLSDYVSAPLTPGFKKWALCYKFYNESNLYLGGFTGSGGWG